MCVAGHTHLQHAAHTAEIGFAAKHFGGNFDIAAVPATPRAAVAAAAAKREPVGAALTAVWQGLFGSD